MGQQNGISWILLVLAVGVMLICSPPSNLEPAHHPAGPFQGSTGSTAHPGTCEDDQPVLTTTLQRAELPGRSDEVSSVPRETHQAQEIGGRGPKMAEGLPAFLPGLPSQGRASAKLYKLYLSYLI